jgi:hypothetical protein
VILWIHWSGRARRNMGREEFVVRVQMAVNCWASGSVVSVMPVGLQVELIHGSEPA